jgi:hypothetical protein
MPGDLDADAQEDERVEFGAAVAAWLEDVEEAAAKSAIVSAGSRRSCSQSCARWRSTGPSAIARARSSSAGAMSLPGILSKIATAIHPQPAGRSPPARFLVPTQ